MRKRRAQVQLNALLVDPSTRQRHRLGALPKLAVLGVVGGLVVAVGMTPAASVAIAGTNVASGAWNSQSDTIPAPALPGRTTLVDASGRTIAQVFTIDRVPVSGDEQSKQVRDAIVSIEDARFYEHNGIDPVGTVRALVATGSNNGVQGGSTITQQYAKNLRIAQAVIEGQGSPDPEALAAASGRSWQRKLAEAHLATVIESQMSKDDILTGYLNVSYFGAGAYGIEAAARRYFSVPAAKLSLPQAALLAGIVQSPSSLDPRINPTGAQERRRQVLNAMVKSGHITSEQAAAANAAPIKLKLSLPAQGCKTAAKAWGMVCDSALRELRTADWLGDEAASLVATGGLTVTLTPTPSVQRTAFQTARQVLPANQRAANAITMVQPGTGAIKAMASNRAFGEGKGETEIPLATTRSFAPASTFKLFTLVAALEAGTPLSTVLPGGTTYTSSKYDNPPGGYHNAEGLSASNVTIAQATEMSINTAYVQLEEKVGIPAIAEAARRLGIAIPPDGQKGAPGKKEGTFTLGARDVSVTDMAGAYAAIANHGVWCPPSLIASVKLPDGTVVNNPVKKRCRQAVDPAVADTAASVLAGVVTRGTGRPAALAGRPAAGKTGTGEDDSSAWFVGFTPQIAAAVWTGDPRSPRFTLHGVMGLSTVYGGTLPADVWRASMNSYLRNKPAMPIAAADPDYLLAPGAPPGDSIAMVDLRGQTQEEATQTLIAMGLTPQVITDPTGQSPWIPAGTVIAQSRQPGAFVSPDTKVQITVATTR